MYTHYCRNESMFKVGSYIPGFVGILELLKTRCSIKSCCQYSICFCFNTSSSENNNLVVHGRPFV